MDLDVGHRTILIFQATLKTSSSLAKKRQFPEAGIATPQNPSEKIHPQADGISVRHRVWERAPNFFNQFRRQDLIGIEQQNPVAGKRQRFHGPLALLRPTARIMK